jgi:hypothetical protein
VTDPTNHAPFDVAVEALPGFDGIGFALGDSYAGIDLDDCFAADGEPYHWARYILEDLAGTYAEVSPSGNGIKLFMRGGKPEGRCRRQVGLGEVEVYGGGRFFTVTGNAFGGAPSELRDCTADLARLHATLFPPEERPAARAATASAESSPLTDAELLEQAPAKDAKFARLWAGDIAGYPSQSEATAALLMKLAFLTGRDRARMDRLFRQSGLMRTKWDSRRGNATWGALEIENACAKQTEVYSPPAPPGQSPWPDEADAPSGPRAVVAPEKSPTAYVDPIRHFVAQATPETGFVRDYLDYAEPFSESPEQFLLSGALTALSVAAGSSAFMHWGDERLLANTYLCLVGPQSIPRKSTAVRVSRRVTEDAIAGPPDAKGEPTCISISETGSDEAIMEEIAAKPAGVMWWSELSGALAQSQKRYSGGLKQLLAELFDAAGQTRTHKLRDEGKTIRIGNPCPHILAATTVAWLSQQVGEWDLYGGFLSRFCYVFGERKSKSLPLRPDHDQPRRDALVTALRRIPREATLQTAAPLRLGRDAEAGYCRFYDEFEERPELRASDAVASFASRLTTYALKLAMLYELGFNPASREVSAEAWAHARAFVDLCYAGALRILEETDRGGDPDVNRVVRILRGVGARDISRRDLMRKTKLRKDRFEPIITTLEESGLVRSWTAKTGGRDARMLRYEPQ